MTSEQDVTVSRQVVSVSLTRCTKTSGFVLLLKDHISQDKGSGGTDQVAVPMILEMARSFPLFFFILCKVRIIEAEPFSMYHILVRLLIDG